MTKISKRTATSLALCAPLIAACAAPTPLPENDPRIAKAIEAFEAGCMDTAPGFAGVKEIWSAQGITQIKENGTNLPHDIFGMVTLKGDCGVGIKGEARKALGRELTASIKRKGIAVIKEARDHPRFSYASIIDYRGQKMIVGVSARPISNFGFWSYLALIPDVPEGEDLTEK